MNESKKIQKIIKLISYKRINEDDLKNSQIKRDMMSTVTTLISSLENFESYIKKNDKTKIVAYTKLLEKQFSDVVSSAEKLE